MLNRKEGEVMKRVYALCKDGGVCLITPAELLASLPRREKWTEEALEKILQDLKTDDYLELLFSERKGEKTYVLSLRAEGYAYPRHALQMRRDFAVKVIWAITSAVIAFAVGWILKFLF
ncbi:MAG: hypothetical protein IJX98_01300 [Clostridia bacterium]|nr:hypothetical protein [Clostridia bacterium]